MLNAGAFNILGAEFNILLFCCKARCRNLLVSAERARGRDKWYAVNSGCEVRQSVGGGFGVGILIMHHITFLIMHHSNPTFNPHHTLMSQMTADCRFHQNPLNLTFGCLMLNSQLSEMIKEFGI